MSATPEELMYIVPFGPDGNCTLALCPLTASIYHYRPSLGANIAFIALFFISMMIHIWQGIRYRTWFFLGAMILGCVTEIIGYGGRIMLWQNPFSFNGFLMQIICITIGPVFFAAAIYATLGTTARYLDPTLSRISPRLYYPIFATCDVISLVMQATGGALSTSSSGSSQPAIDDTLAGLSFQVFTLVIFAGLCVDYAVRYARRRSLQKKEQSSTSQPAPLPLRFKLFAVFLALAILLILIRSAYRIDELSDGYSGPLIHDEALFIALEGAMIAAAAFALNVAHPGPAMAGPPVYNNGGADAPHRAGPAVGEQSVLEHKHVASDASDSEGWAPNAA